MSPTTCPAPGPGGATCGRPVRAYGVCASHARQVDRAAARGAKVRLTPIRTGQGLRPLSTKVPQDVLDWLGPAPGTRAREVLTAAARRGR